MKILAFDISDAASEVFKGFSQYLKARINLTKLPEYVVLLCRIMHNRS